MAIDRSHYPTRRVRLADEGRDADVRACTPAERLAMVWQLTVDAYAMRGVNADERRLSRHVVRVVRGRR